MATKVGSWSILRKLTVTSESWSIAAGEYKLDRCKIVISRPQNE